MELVPLKNGKWLTVRAAEPGDAAAFMAFSRLVGGETDNLMLDSRGFFGTVEEKAEYLSAALADRRYCIMLATIEGEMVGFFSIAPMGDGKLRGQCGFRHCGKEKLLAARHRRHTDRYCNRLRKRSGLP